MSSSEDKFDEVVEAILDVSTFEILSTVDSFNRKGDGIEFRDVENMGRNRDPYNTYLRGKSTNPEVGDDIWSVDWIVTSLEKHRLTCGNPSEDRNIIELYSEFNDLFSEEESEEDYDDESDD